LRLKLNGTEVKQRDDTTSFTYILKNDGV